MKVYVLMFQEYDDAEILGVYQKLKDAEFAKYQYQNTQSDWGKQEQWYSITEKDLS